MKFSQIGTYIFLLLLLFGCQANDAQDNATQQNSEGQRVPSQTSLNQQNEEVNQTDDADKVAKHLVDLATSLPNINDATAIVVGDLAVVGIDVNAGLDQSEVGTIKYAVTEAFHGDPLGANAVVVADPDLNARLKEMQKDIENGHPIAGIMEELAGIVGRVMPIVPGREHENEDPTDANNEKLNNEQQKQLNHQQDEHAKKDTDQNKQKNPEQN